MQSGIICNNKVPNRVKGKIHEVVVRPAMLYGMETQPLTKKQESKLDVADMKMSRWMLGLTRKDRIRNEEVRRRLGTGELSGQCRQAILRWYGHVKRGEEDNVCRRVMEMAVPGKWKTGRPRRRWKDCLKEDMEAVGATEEDTQDRLAWRRKVHMAATPQA